MWWADRDHGQLHRGASSRRVILPRAGTTPACRHRSACATSPEQGVSMKLPVRIAPLLFLVVLLGGCQDSDPAVGAAVSPASAAPASAGSEAIADDNASNDVAPAADRSEEHTSELQSLMRISYAVFCLQQNKHSSTAQLLQTIP